MKKAEPQKIMINGTIPTTWDGKHLQCPACDATIGFSFTKAGKRIPIDLHKDQNGHFTSHLMTCPEEKKFLKGMIA